MRNVPARFSDRIEQTDGTTALATAISTAGQSGGGSAGAAVTAASLPAQPPSPTPFTINISWDASVANAPTGFTTDVLNAVYYLESQYTDPVTINIAVGYGEYGGASLPSGALGASNSAVMSVNYAQLRPSLAADVKTASDASAVTSLPSTSPAPAGSTYFVTTAQAKALGILSATNPTVDGSIGFSSSAKFTYGDNATGGPTARGSYDFFSTVVHETTEVMGRLMFVGGTIGPIGKSESAFDLFHYSSSNTRTFSRGGYFSVDNGKTNLGTLNSSIFGGDAGDWSSTVKNDAFDASASSGVINKVTANDLITLDAIGWDQTGGTGTVSGIGITAATAPLVTAASGDGLAGNLAMANLMQQGGAAAHSYSYALSGSSAFQVANAVGVPVISTTSAGAAGAAGGLLSQLSVTATDTTATGSPSVSAPLDIVVGISAADAITLSALGANPATPTFIYGLAGNDTINAGTMNGPLWFIGGAGADTLTGGTGINHYLYGAAADSSPTAMDVITNFNAASDLIDLTGLQARLSDAGALAGTASTLAANSLGWQVSGGNTFVYVNTSGAPENLSATDMKIQLNGQVALNTGNVLHLTPY